MAPSLRFAAFAAACCILLAGSARSRPPPAVYDVGDKMGWTVPPPGNSADTFNKWAMRHPFLVGDVLDFKYSNDSVLLVRRDDYEECSTARPGVQFNDGDTRFRLDWDGLFYFISGEPGHCEAGQRMVVRVVDVDAARSSLVGAPTPAPAMQPSGTASGDRPIPLAYKMFVAATIGFVTGCFFVWLILWLCVSFCH